MKMPRCFVSSGAFAGLVSSRASRRLALAAALLALLPATGRAVDIIVDSSLASSVSAAGNGDTLILQSDLSPPTVVALAGKNLNFRSAGDVPVTINAPATDAARVFTVTVGNTLNFQNVILKGSEVGTSAIGMAINVSGTPTQNNGVYVPTTFGGSFTVTGFRTLTTGSNYGALYGGTTNTILKLGSTGGTVTVSDNVALNGGGAGIRGFTIEFDADAVLSGNISGATAGGGGIYAAGLVTFNADATVAGNQATNGTSTSGTHGAGIFSSNTVRFKGDALIENNVNANGNGAGVRSATNVIFDGASILRGNAANKTVATAGANGGAVWTGTDLTINGAMNATDNTAASNGGALFVTNGNLTVGAGSIFERNHAVAGTGGAIYVAAPTAAKTHQFNATTGDILFRDNTGVDGRNAVHFVLTATAAQTINFAADAGRTISFFDPITSTNAALATVNKTGDGTLLFDTYTTTLHAATNVAAGTLQVANNATYGSADAGTSVTVASGATLAGMGTIRAETITLGTDSTLRATDGGTLTLAGNVTGTGVALTGNGTLAAGNALGAKSITVDSGGTLTLQQNATLADGGTLGATGTGGTIAAGEGIALAGNAVLTADAGQSVAVSAALSGASGSVTKSGAGTATLSGSNSYAGGTTVSAGTLQVAGASALGTGTVTNNATLDVALAADGTVANAIAGTGTLTKSGANVATLTGANTYTGATTIAEGTLLLGSSAAATGLAASSGVAIADNATATLDLAGQDATVSSLTGAGRVALGDGQLTVATSSSAVYAGTVSGAAGSALVKSGTGTLELSGAQPLAAGFAGDVAVNGGTLNVTGGTLATTGSFTLGAGTTLGLAAGTGAIDAGSVAFGANSILNITGYNASTLGSVTLITSDTAIANSTNATLRFDGATVTPSLDQYLALELNRSLDGRTISLVSDLAWNSQSAAHGTFALGAGASFTSPVALANNTAFTGTLGNWDGRTLTKTGAGTLVFNQANTYTGATQVEGGTLQLATANAIATSQSVTVASGATLDLADNNQTLRNLSGAGAIALGSATLTANQSSDLTLSGVISGIGGSLVKDGTGTLTLSGANTHTGGTAIMAGKLSVTQTAALGVGGVTNQGTLEFAAGADGAYAGTLSGAGALNKLGTGSVALTAATGSAGAVSVQGGTLGLGDGTAATAFTATSAAVSSGATLTVDRDSTLGLTGALTLANGSTLNLVVGSNAPVISAASASIGATGTTLNVNGISGSTAMPFTLLATTSGITGDFAAVNVGGSGGGATDYLVVTAAKSGNNYVVNTSLAWNSPTANPNGVFTLASAAETFDLGTVLANQAANPATGWDGRSLTKAGDGTLILSAANTYTGTTTLNGGTLRFGIANAIAPSSAVTLAAGTTLDLNGFNQTLTGLSGAGDIALGSATLTAATAANATLSGVISGTGALVKQGAGTLTLTGSNTYSGGTTISAGRLTVASLGALGTGGIVNNAALEFGSTVSGTFAGTLGGNGTVTKLGTGTLALTGNSSAFTGSTSVLGGVLAVNGTLGGALTIGSGARLQGTGTVGTTTIASGGRFAPGNSIGTTNVAGNLTFANGSIFEVEIDNTGAADRVNVSGTATIQAGAGVNVTKAGGTYVYGTRYTILTAAGGITGNFTTLEQNLPLIDLMLTKDANSLYLDVSRNTIAFDEYARTPNERATAAAIEAFGHLHPLYIAITNLTDENAIAVSYAHLSGEIHASILSALIDDSRFIREVPLERGSGLAAATEENSERAPGSALWIQTIGGAGNSDGNDEIHAVERSKFGVLAGIDGAMSDHLRGGLVFGVSRGSIDAPETGSSATASHAHVGTYANLRAGAFGLSAGATYTRSFVDTTRIVTFSGFGDETDVRREATTMQAFGEAAWQLRYGSVNLEPYVNAAFVRVESDEFSEHGDDAVLSGAKAVHNVPLTTAGLRASYIMQNSRPHLRFLGSLGWQMSHGDRAVTQDLAFFNGNTFTVAGEPVSREMIVAEGSVGFFLGSATRLDLGYSGRFASAKQDHALRAIITRSF